MWATGTHVFRKPSGAFGSARFWGEYLQPSAWSITRLPEFLWRGAGWVVGMGSGGVTRELRLPDPPSLAVWVPVWARVHFREVVTRELRLPEGVHPLFPTP